MRLQDPRVRALTLDDVVYLEHLGLAFELDADVGEHRHQGSAPASNCSRESQISLTRKRPPELNAMWGGYVFCHPCPDRGRSGTTVTVDDFDLCFDHLSDCFGLGVPLFARGAGRYPFSAEIRKRVAPRCRPSVSFSRSRLRAQSVGPSRLLRGRCSRWQSSRRLWRLSVRSPPSVANGTSPS
jgi:hypothetical protein